MQHNSEPVKIDPDGIYHNGEARRLLGLTDATMRRARADGRLRYSRQGTRIIYRGQWIINWLEATSTGGDADAK